MNISEIETGTVYVYDHPDQPARAVEAIGVVAQKTRPIRRPSMGGTVRMVLRARRVADGVSFGEGAIVYLNHPDLDYLQPFDPRDWFQWPDGECTRWCHLSTIELEMLGRSQSGEGHHQWWEMLQGVSEHARALAQASLNGYWDPHKPMTPHTLVKARDHFRAVAERENATVDKPSPLRAALPMLKAKEAMLKACEAAACFADASPSGLPNPCMCGKHANARDCRCWEEEPREDADHYGTWSVGDVEAYLDQFGDVTTEEGGEWYVRNGLFKCTIEHSKRDGGYWATTLWGLDERPVFGDPFPSPVEAMEWAQERWRELAAGSVPGARMAHPVARDESAASGSAGAVGKTRHIMSGDLGPRTEFGAGWGAFGEEQDDE